MTRSDITKTSRGRVRLVFAILFATIQWSVQQDIAQAAGMTAEYVRDALMASVHGNPAEGGDRLSLWTGVVPVRVHYNCAEEFLGGHAGQDILASQLIIFISQINELQDNVHLEPQKVQCDSGPINDDQGKFGIAVVLAGGYSHVEHAILSARDRDGAQSLLFSIRNGSPAQFDTGCFASGFRASTDTEYKAAAIYIDPAKSTFSPGKCGKVGLLSAMGLVGNMENFPESIKSFSHNTNAVSNLDKCLVKILYSRDVRPGLTLSELSSVSTGFARELCAEVVRP